jgi:hypothetical protein
MRIIRLTGLALVAILAVSLAAVSVAAATPSFNPANGQSLTVSGGTSTLTSGTEVVTCTSDAISAKIASAMLAGPFVIDFSGCKSAGATKSGCTVSSTNTSNSGLILTTTLHAVLGLALPSNVAGLLILPTSGKRFVTLAGNECTEETRVNGSVAGLITPIGSEQTTGKIVFTAPSGKQEIKDIDTLSGLIKPELEAFAQTATEVNEQSVTFGEATEVT